MKHQLAASEQLDSSREQEEYRNTHLLNQAKVEDNLGKQYSSRAPLLDMAIRADTLVGRGLETRSSASSRTRIQELKAEQLQLDMERLKIRQQQISLELENLAGSVQPSDEESTSDEPPGLVPLDSVRKYVECCRASATHRVPEDAESRTINNLRIKLPDIELIRFEGTPKRLWKFLSSFKADVASGLPNDRERLCYLIHCCVGEAREAIEDCVMLPPKEGYVRAIDILESQFGCPDDAAECLLDEMGNGTKIKPTDITGLRKLVRQVVSSEISLTEMGYESSLNCPTTVKGIVRRLPDSMQLRWAEIALKKRREGTKLLFRHLVRYLEGSLSTFSYCYGQGNRALSQWKRDEDTRQSHGVRGRITVIAGRLDEKCPVCFEDHGLEFCSKFLSVCYEERLRVIQDAGWCFKCLKLGHRAAACRTMSRCLELNCYGHHHTLMHVPRSPNTPTKANINSVKTEVPHTCMGFVPVRLLGPKGSKETYALLDNGSDSTLLSSAAANSLGIDGPLTRLSVTTLAGTASQVTSEVNFAVQSLSGDYQPQVERAYTLKTLPVQTAYIPSGLESWSHLRDVHFEEIKDRTVDLLIGTNTPESHWVQDQRIGTSRQPYAVKTVLGWVLLGPTGRSATQWKYVNCLASEVTMESEILKLYETEFGDATHNEKLSHSLEDKVALEIVQGSVTIVEGHYQLSLPWKRNWREIPENRYLAERRLNSLRIRFLKDPNLLSKYTDIMETYERKGYISRVPESQYNETRFIPHHPLINLS
ncbi:Protein disulfide-isomerase [Fasciola gigantica]|uniref:Protein disulfide-isomerase n=1 Tax=Fasciola gigantica TaxID=46835 RepID=A0A504YGX3_FASGI|nr:Protein disulfide-isomerase [Fasciola gigantica]